MILEFFQLTLASRKRTSVWVWASINVAASFGVVFPSRFTRVKQLHGQIGGVVQTLNDKIAKVLQKQEKEFLAAYRAHMYQVRPFALVHASFCVC